MHENLALEQPVEELDNLEKHARNLVKGRYVTKMMTMLAMVMKESSAFLTVLFWALLCWAVDQEWVAI